MRSWGAGKTELVTLASATRIIMPTRAATGVGKATEAAIGVGLTGVQGEFPACLAPLIEGQNGAWEFRVKCTERRGNNHQQDREWSPHLPVFSASGQSGLKKLRRLFAQHPADNHGRAVSWIGDYPSSNNSKRLFIPIAA